MVTRRYYINSYLTIIIAKIRVHLPIQLLFVRSNVGMRGMYRNNYELIYPVSRANVRYVAQVCRYTLYAGAFLEPNRTKEYEQFTRNKRCDNNNYVYLPRRLTASCTEIDVLVRTRDVKW